MICQKFGDFECVGAGIGRASDGNAEVKSGEVEVVEIAVATGGFTLETAEKFVPVWSSEFSGAGFGLAASAVAVVMRADFPSILNDTPVCGY